MMKKLPNSSISLLAGGVILMLLGAYFIFIRPPLLPEDPRYMGTSLEIMHSTIPGIAGWLRHVFWVMGGYMFSTGLLTLYVALTGFRDRTRGALAVAVLSGLTSIGWMVVVNFMIASDFKWLLAAFALPWIGAVIFYLLEGKRPLFVTEKSQAAKI